jgi:hypothetical protein
MSNFRTFLPEALCLERSPTTGAQRGYLYRGETPSCRKFSGSPRRHRQTIRHGYHTERNIRDNPEASVPEESLYMMAWRTRVIQDALQRHRQSATSGLADLKRYRLPLYNRAGNHLILMWPCFTTMKVQKLVYGPRFAVRGSGIECPLLSRLVTAPGPGLCDQ